MNGFDRDLLAVGETMVMITPERGGRLTAGNTYVLRPGGAESNVAVHLARMGHTAAWASAVGVDPLGDIVVDSLNADGVDTELVRRDPSRPTAVYFKDPAERGTAVFYYRSGSAASCLDESDLQEWMGSRPRLAFVSGITPALSANTRLLTHRLVRERALGGVPVVFDVNHRAPLWNGDGPEELLDLARHSDIVFVGRDEAEGLWGTSDAASVRTLIPQPDHLVVKDGSVEATAFTPSGTFRASALRVPVVDVVGAGDAFAAGWLSGLLSGRDETTRLRMGHYVASRVIMSPSDSAELPSADLVAEFAQLGVTTLDRSPVHAAEGAGGVADRRTSR